MPKAKKQRTEAVLDQFIGHISGHGDVAVAALVRDVLGHEQPKTSQVENAILLFKDDARFVVTDKGMHSTVRMADEPAQGEPEEITLPAAESPFVTEEPPFSQDDGGQAFPSTTGEAAPVPSIGEQLEKSQADAAAQDDAPDIDTVHQVAGSTTVEHDTLARLKQVKAAIDAQENTIHHLGEDLKAHKDRLKVLEAERDALIDGEIPPTRDGETDPEQTPIAKAHRGEVPPIVEPNGLGLIRGMGANCATAGKLETDCPYSREENAKERSMWLDGYRETMREDKSERPAEVQGLFRDALVDAMVTNSLGLLEPGAETPKVATVKWDERPHLVGGMCAADENPGAIERWSLVPLFTKQEWAETFADDFGPAIKGVDKSDEAKANRQKRGVDTGRMVKAGRSTLVVGPLSRLMVATVKPTDGQPSH